MARCKILDTAHKEKGRQRKNGMAYKSKNEGIIVGKILNEFMGRTLMPYYSKDGHKKGKK